jgi:hypothetical protein
MAGGAACRETVFGKKNCSMPAVKEDNSKKNKI